MRSLTLPVGDWRFVPGLWPTIAALFFFGLTLGLGNWQSQRAEAKRALQARYDVAAREPPVHVGNAVLDVDSVLYRKLEATGVFDDARTILLDNRVLRGVPGYHVLTPLRIDGSGTALLVNRGWLPARPDRRVVAVPPAPSGPLRVEGMAVPPQSRYLELSAETRQGQVWQNLDFARYAELTGLRLQPALLLQTRGADDGLRREWPRPDTGVAMHTGYALQWYGLATTVVVLWLVLNMKRQHKGGA